MTGSHPPLILASSSPRRLELLSQIGLTPDEVIPADIDETILKNELPRDLALRLAMGKAAKIAAENPDAFVLAADTVVAAGRRILDKPRDEKDVRTALQLLSGRRHKVYGGICVAAPNGKVKSATIETTVSIRRLSDAEISAYVESGEWQGKAGSYAIQGIFAPYIKFLSGSYSNVIGLSLYDTMRILDGLGYQRKV